MMDKKLKQALQEIYCAPAPEGKGTFLKRHRRRELGRWELLSVQVGYIRWWVWAVSMALFGAIFWTTVWAEGMGRWYAAAFTPFLALLVVMENGRAQVYQMEELELACRVPRAGVLLARMVGLGLFHLALLAALTPALAVWGSVSTVQAGVYLLTPYLSTAALGMELTRRVRGREGLVACGGAAAAVSAAGTLAANLRPELYRPGYLSLWGLALAASALAAWMEIMLNLKERELQWN